MIDGGIEEHHVVKVLLEEIAGLDPGADDWIAKLVVVVENVEHHAGGEDETFPQIPSESGGELTATVNAG